MKGGRESVSRVKSSSSWWPNPTEPRTCLEADGGRLADGHVGLRGARGVQLDDLEEEQRGPRLVVEALQLLLGLLTLYEAGVLGFGT